MHQGTQVAGHLHITRFNVCFSSDQLKEIIPYTELASVQRSVALETIDQGPPFFMIVPAPNVVPNCLQIFTVRQQLFQFLDFTATIASKAGSVMSSALKGTPLERAYNFLDHAWRAAVTVPLQGVNYIPA
jgi:hypothetical protein